MGQIQGDEEDEFSAWDSVHYNRSLYYTRTNATVNSFYFYFYFILCLWGFIDGIREYEHMP